MTERRWLAKKPLTGPDDTARDRIGRDRGLDDPHDLDTRGVIRGFIVSLVLPLTAFGIALVILLWMVIAKFNLLTF